ncbi:MAG: hypothetical protein R3E88_11830 [Myxococcota bacterium]
MNEPASVAVAGLGDALSLLFASGDAAGDALVATVAGIGLAAIACVHGSLAARLARVGVLVRDVAHLYASRARADRDGTLRRDLDRTFTGSLLSDAWTELARRRREIDAQAQAPDERSAARFADVLAERPLIPFGVRRRLLGSLPALLAALGGSATLAMLAAGLGASASGTAIAPIAGLALRGAFVGLVLATLAAALASVLEGAADALTARLCAFVERSHRSLTPVEAQLRNADAQRLGFERVSALLVQVAQDLRDTLDRGLGRIERSTASAASLVGEEQRRVLELVIDDLSGLVRRSVEDHVGALRGSLERAAEQQGALDERMAATATQVRAGAESTARVAGTLERAAEAMDEAAGTIAGSAGELKPLVGHLGEVASAIERAAIRIEQVQAMQRPGEDAAASALAALRTDVARIGEQLVAGTDALRRQAATSAHDAAPERRALLHADRDVVDAIEELEQRALALRERAAEAPRPAPAPPTAAAPAPAPRAEAPAPAPEALDEDLAIGGPPDAADDPLAEPVAAVGKSGYSALLSRYKAPQFSIDELPAPLRDFDAEALSRRALGGAAEAPAPDAEGTDGADPSGRPAPRERAADAAAGDRGETEEERRRRRLDRFLGRG